jgi:hypothetical protein
MISLPVVQVNNRRQQRAEKNETFQRKPMRLRGRATISPRLGHGHRGSTPWAALTHEDNTTGTFLAEHNR